MYSMILKVCMPVLFILHGVVIQVLLAMEHAKSMGLIPKIVSEPNNITVIAGETAIFTCRVETRGKHTVIWMNPQHIVITKEDQKVIDDSRVSIERQYTQDWNLHIRNIQYRDEGTYKCIVNTDKPLIRHIYLSVRVPPHIDEASSSKSKIEVLEGRTVELNCNASGVPTPRIRWFRITTYDMGNKEEIMETNPWETLLIRNISRHCEGTYECVAHNNVKFSVSKTIQVIVVFRPEVSLTTKRLGQYMGKETVLQCRVSASPRTICAWERNGQELRTTMGKYRLTIYEDDPHSISLNLQIHELAPEDYGEYRCFASNSYGEDSETMVLYESRDEVLYTSTVTTTPRGSQSGMEVLPPVSYDTPRTTGLEFVGGAHEGMSQRSAANKERFSLHFTILLYLFTFFIILSL